MGPKFAFSYPSKMWLGYLLLSPGLSLEPVLLECQLWDINMDSGPVATFQVHEHLRPKVRFLSFNRTEPIN